MANIKSVWQRYGHQLVRAGFLALFLFAGWGLIEGRGFSMFGHILYWFVVILLWLFIAMQIEPIGDLSQEVMSRSTGSVTINFKLNEGEFGSKTERDRIHRLTDELDQLVTAQQVGEYDGDEFGNSECELYFFSDQPERLFEVVKPVLANSEYAKTVTVVIEEKDESTRKPDLL